MSGSQYPDSYSQEDMQQILHIAIARQIDRGEITRQELAEIASEIGIATEDLQAAEQEWLVQQNRQQTKTAFDSYRQNKLKQKFVKYLLVNTFLVSINLLLGGTLSWSLYILLFWGLGIAYSAWKTYQNEGEEYEQAFRNWERKHLVKRTIATLWDRAQLFLLSKV